MPRLVVRLFSGLFVAAQLALCSAGVWADATQELAVLSADIHVESQAESCIPRHDHRLCVLVRSAERMVVARTTIPTQPVVAEGVAQGSWEVAAAAADPSHQPPPRGPPSIT